MPIFVNFTNGFLFHLNFFKIIGFLWVISLIFRVFLSKTFVFLSWFLPFFTAKNLPSGTVGRFL